MHEPHHDIGHLDAGIIDVVLHFDAIARGLENMHERIANH